MRHEWSKYGSAELENKVLEIQSRLNYIRYLRTGLAGYTQGDDTTEAYNEASNLEEDLEEINKVLNARKRV